MGAELKDFIVDQFLKESFIEQMVRKLFIQSVSHQLLLADDRVTGLVPIPAPLIRLLAIASQSRISLSICPGNN